jgi:alkylresorcinol/alkylpyrone synthase
MAERAHLLSLATALPPNVLWQREVAAKAHAVFGPYFEDFERLAGMFTTSGIEKRHGVKPLDWYLDPAAGPSARRHISRAPRRCLSTRRRRRSRKRG